MLALCTLLSLALPQEAKVVAAEPVVVQLAPRHPDQQQRLAWSPKGQKVALRRVQRAAGRGEENRTDETGKGETRQGEARNGGDGESAGRGNGGGDAGAGEDPSHGVGESGVALVGLLHLGPPQSPPVRVRLERSPGAKSFDRLLLDHDRDGDLTDETPLCAEPKELRGKLWSSFEDVLPIPATAPAPTPAPTPKPTRAPAAAGSVSGHPQIDAGLVGIEPAAAARAPHAAPAAPAAGTATPGEIAAPAIPYPLSLWYVFDPREPDAEPVLRFTRRGWMQGEAQLDGRQALVMLTESWLDGVIDRRDSWALAPADHPAELMAVNRARSLERHAWLGETAWHVVAIDDGGLRVTLQMVDPGLSRADEERAADLHAEDRRAKRSGRSLDFGTDLDAALAQAAREQKHVLLDFTTTWCGPCRLMEQYVYTADAVVDAAQDLIAVQIDGDARRDLVRRFAVRAYPTVLLLEADGTVMKRAAGYRGVEAMVQLLRR